MYLYGINHFKVTLSKDQIYKLQEKFLFHEEIWYEYGTYWMIMYADHVKSRIKEFLRLLDLYVNTYELDNFELIKKLLYKNVELDKKHLICFKNGIYDLKLHQFRTSSPYDYCTKCTKYNYKKIVSNPLQTYLHEVFPLQKDYIQFMNALYLILIGYKLLVYGIYDGRFNSFYALIYDLFGSYITACSLEDYKLSRKEPYIMDIDLRENVSRIEKILTHSLFVSQRFNINYDYPLSCKLQSNSTAIMNNFKSLDLKDCTALMYQLLQMEEVPIKLLNFKNNTIFINDITHYILSYYNDLIYV